MDVEFEEVEEFVRDEIERAVYVFFDAEEEFEGAAGFVARWEGDVLELAGSVGDLEGYLVRYWRFKTLWWLGECSIWGIGG